MTTLWSEESMYFETEVVNLRGRHPERSRFSGGARDLARCARQLSVKEK